MIFLASLHESMSDKLEGYYLIHTKKELDRIVADNTQSSRVIVKEDFAREYFTPSGLLIYIQNAKTFNRNLIITLEDSSEVVTPDGFVNKLKAAKGVDELITLAAMYPAEFEDAIHTLLQDRDRGSNELFAAANMVSRLQAVIEGQNKRIAELEYAVSLEQANKQVAMDKLDVLVKRINYQYNAHVDEGKLFVLEGNRFDKVLYIKEYSRVQYMDSFLYYLKEILKILYKMPTRMVVVEAYYGTLCPGQYPGFVPHNKLREKDVLSGDILMLGVQTKLMGDILKNPSGVSILIVLDRGKYRMPHIKGKNIEYFYAASDLADLPESIPKERIFSYSEETMFIPYIDNFSHLDSSGRIAKYSSMRAMKQMVKFVEGR